MRKFLLLVGLVLIVTCVSATLNSSTSLYLPMNGTAGCSTFVDLAKGHTITVSGNPMINNTQYKFYNSTFFDGNGDYFTITYDADLNLAGDYTIMGWFNVSTIGASSGRIMSSGAHAGGTVFYEICLTPTNLFVQLYDGSSYMYSVFSDTIDTVNNWHFFMVSKHGGNITVSVDSVNGTEGIYTGSVFPATDWIIARDGGSYTTMFMDDLVILKGVAMNTNTTVTREFISNPQSIIKPNKTSARVPAPILFENATLGNQQSLWNWSFINDSYSTPTYFGANYNATYTFTINGTYYVSLNTTNPFGYSVNTIKLFQPITR